MANFLLSIDPNKDGNFYFSNFGEALVYALIGFLVVFVGIVLIILIIWLIGLILRKTDNLAFITKRRKKPKTEEIKESNKQEDIADGEIPEEVKVAVIAAIMAYYSEEKPKCEFKVRRIKRI